MFARIALFLGLASAVSALHMTMMAQKSQALPFLNRPAKLDGGVGDFGFDPLGLSDTINQNYARAAELKNARVAMLACVGFVFQQYVHVVADEANPFKAIEAVGYMANIQIFSAIGAVELATWDKTFSGSSAPGDYGFDPMGQLKGKSAKDVETMKLKEINNGRLAMVAIIGMFVQNLAFNGQPTI